MKKINLLKKKKEKENFFHRKEMGIINTDTEFEAVEAYKSLRTNITFSMSQREHKRILFTSAVPMEGKTSTICNFAVVLAQAGYKVLLIDGDMRQSRVHSYFKMAKGKHGLSSVLSTGKLENCSVDSGYPNLTLMFAGMTPPNPAELLEGKFAQQFFDGVEEYFDYVLVDTPPVGIMTDALILKKYDFSMVLVSRESYSDHRDVQAAIKAIQMVGGDLIGSVLIGSKSALASKKDGYKYGYKYYGYADASSRAASNAKSGVLAGTLGEKNVGDK